MAMSFCRQASIMLTTVAAATAVHGQQLLQRVTDAQCRAAGGHIITYTNTAGVGPDVGDCLVPPRIGGAGGVGGIGGGAAGNIGAALQGIGAGLGILGDVLGRRHAPPASPDPQPRVGDDHPAPAPQPAPEPTAPAPVQEASLSPAAMPSTPSCADFDASIDSNATCRAIGVTREDCEDTLHGHLTSMFGYQYCVFRPAAASEPQDAGPAVEPGALRDRLARQLLNRDRAAPDVDADATTTAALPSPDSTSAPDAAPVPGSAEDDILRAYLNSRDPSTGGTRGGDLGAPPPLLRDVQPLPLGNPPTDAGSH
jgi:hypothetical protein